MNALLMKVHMNSGELRLELGIRNSPVCFSLCHLIGSIENPGILSTIILHSFLKSDWEIFHIC